MAHDDFIQEAHVPNLNYPLFPPLLLDKLELVHQLNLLFVMISFRILHNPKIYPEQFIIAYETIIKIGWIRIRSASWKTRPNSKGRQVGEGGPHVDLADTSACLDKSILQPCLHVCFFQSFVSIWNIFFLSLEQFFSLTFLTFVQNISLLHPEQFVSPLKQTSSSRTIHLSSGNN